MQVRRSSTGRTDVQVRRGWWLSLARAQRGAAQRGSLRRVVALKQHVQGRQTGADPLPSSHHVPARGPGSCVLVVVRPSCACSHAGEFSPVSARCSAGFCCLLRCFGPAVLSASRLLWEAAGVLRREAALRTPSVPSSGFGGCRRFAGGGLFVLKEMGN